VLLTKYSLGDRIDKIEMDRACSTNGGKQRCIQDFVGGNLRERNNLGDSGVDGRIMLRWNFRNWDMGVKIGSRWLGIGTTLGHL